MTTNTNPEGTMAAHLSHVEITDNSTDPQLVALDMGDGYTVHPIWSGVDRPNVGGWMVKDLAMARRLERAILDGAAFDQNRIEVLTDVNGQTYVSAPHAVMGKRMNADLKRLGY